MSANISVVAPWYLPMSSESLPASTHNTIGHQGELFVAQWLQAQGWVVLQTRWQCRWGELDLIVGQPSATPHQFTAIAFVEVKTRRANNWDLHGKLAITPQKQAKLWQAAQLFLAEHPEWAELPCQFDVALVRCDRPPQRPPKSNAPAPPYHLVEYIPDAFSL